VSANSADHPTPVTGGAWLTNLDRNAAAAAVTGQPDGTFVFRPSSKASSGYVMTWNFQGGVTNSKIERTDAGFSIARGTDHFDTLEALAAAAQSNIIAPMPCLLKMIEAAGGGGYLEVVSPTDSEAGFGFDAAPEAAASEQDNEVCDNFDDDRELAAMCSQL